MIVDGYLEFIDACQKDGLRQTLETLGRTSRRIDHAVTMTLKVIGSESPRLGVTFDVQQADSLRADGATISALRRVLLGCGPGEERELTQLVCGEWFESTVKSLILFGARKTNFRLWGDRFTFGAWLTFDGLAVPPFDPVITNCAPAVGSNLVRQAEQHLRAAVGEYAI